MKRFRFGEEAEMEIIEAANALLLLSRDRDTGPRLAETSPGREFECKTCNRWFPSFQALGVHRASHRKPRILLDDGHDHGRNHGVLAKRSRVHECYICGHEFGTGQALGGHMTRHRAPAEGGKRMLSLLDLDLNLPPSESEVDIDCKKLGLGVELADRVKVSMVDCFHILTDVEAGTRKWPGRDDPQGDAVPSVMEDIGKMAEFTGSPTKLCARNVGRKRNHMI